jgi:isochorismate synthase
MVPDEHMARGWPDAFFWHGRDGVRAVGLGVAARACVNLHDGTGDHVALARRAIDQLWPRVQVEPAPAGTPRPRLFGGFAFAAGWRDDEAWAGFPDAEFVLPRWSCVHDGRRAYVTVAIPGDVPLSGFERPTRPPEVSGPDGARVQRAAGHEIGWDREAWIAHVERIRDEIRKGRFEKLVAARRTVFEVSGLEGVDVASRLGGVDDDRTFRFLIARDGAAFVGASPERLVRRRGPDVATEALAGTIATCLSEPGALLGRAKDRAEHAIVAREVERALGRLCSPVEVASEPEVRALRHVAHLWTPIRARLRPGVDGHLLALAGALHPTPAVGGAPGPAATAWIRAHEVAPRGWYAGAVGWVDDHGDGELAVALRCGVIARGRAYVHAGAGIVADSDPAAEYEETKLKQRAFVHALQGGPDGR